MSARLEARAEVIKLARLLSADAEDLAFLEELPPAELRAFREHATDRLFDAGGRTLGRVASAARLLPSGLVATIAERAFGPLLCARAAGAVDTAKALDVARRLPAPFLADVTVELDPRRVAAIIAEVPEALVVPVAAELGRREEHVTMGRFLAFVPDHAIAAAMGALDDEAMLRTAFVLEHKDRLDHAIGLLPPERLPGILRTASALDLWPEALDLLDHLGEARRGPIADVVAEQDHDVVAALVAAVKDGGLWDSLLPVVRTMSPGHRERLAAMPAFHEPAILRDIIAAAATQGLWADLVPLLDALPDAVRATIPEIIGAVEPTGDLVATLTAPLAVRELLALLPADLVDAVQDAARRHGLQDELERALAEAGG